MRDLSIQIHRTEEDCREMTLDPRAIDAEVSIVLRGFAIISLEGKRVRLEPVRGQRGVTVGNVTHFEVIRVED